MKGKAKYSWPPCTKKFESAAFEIENIIYFLTKWASLMSRSTVLSLPPQLVFPAWFVLDWAVKMLYKKSDLK